MAAVAGKDWVRIVLGLVLLGAVGAFAVDLGEARRLLGGARWEWVAALVAWQSLDRWVMAYKWRLLVVSRGLKLGWWEALGAYYLASFAGSFLPSTVGGDAIRVGVLGRRGLAWEMVGASVVMERALGVVATGVAAGVGLVLLGMIKAAVPKAVVWSVVGVMVVGAAGVVVSLSPLVQRIKRWLGKGQRFSRLRGWLGRLLEAYHGYRHHKRLLVGFTLLTLAEQGFPVIGAWMAARALGAQLGIIQAAAVTPLAVVVARLPVAASAFGVMEGLFVAFFSLVGLGPTEAFFVGFMNNLAMVASCLPGLVYWFRITRH